MAATANCLSSNPIYRSTIPKAVTSKISLPVQVKCISGMNSSLQLTAHGKGLHYGQVSSDGNFCVYADYNGRRDVGTGDFVAGFLLGGVVFGALGYLLGPQVSKTLSGAERESTGASSKELPKNLDDDEGLEKTRRNLNEKIAQLNAAIDDVSAQLRADGGFGSTNGSTPEVESMI